MDCRVKPGNDDGRPCPGNAATHAPSYAGLTRVSITLAKSSFFAKSLSKRMDCRVKPCNDDGRPCPGNAAIHPASYAGLTRVSITLRKECFLRKGVFRSGWIAGSSPAMTTGN